jgi:hypothetical protein
LTEALTLGARGAEGRRWTAVTTFFATAVLGADLPMLDRYFFFFETLEEGVVFFVAGVVAPRHTPTARSAVNPTLGKEIIL